jgi:hypothetical protein
LDEALHDELHGILAEGIGHDGSQHQAAEWGVHGDDFEGGPDADFHVDVGGGGARTARCQGEAARQEMKAAVGAFVENDRAFAVEDEQAGGGKPGVHPIAVLPDAFEK